MRKPFVVLISFLFVSAFLAGATAQAKSISPADTFTIPAFNSQIRFSTNLTYTTANLENNTWFFTGLYGSGKAGFPIHDNLHISAQNCKVVVFYLQSWPQPESHYSSTEMQWIKYTVAGRGTQTLDGNDLFPNSVNYTQWTVKINGETKPMGDDWSYSTSKQLTITTLGQQSTVEVSVYHVPVSSDLAPLPSPEPALKNFSSTDYFPTPSNGSINFAVSGSFDKASLDNDTWNFVNLTLSNYAINAGIFAPNVTGRNVLPYILKCGYPANLGICALNSNVSITGISPLTWESYSPEINYTVHGIGSQIFTFPFKLSAFNWTVILDGLSGSSNNGCFFTSDYQLKVTNATSNVVITGEPLPNDWTPKVINPVVFNLAFAATAIILSTVIVFLMIRRQRSKSKIHD